LGTTTINSKKNALEEREELYIDTAEAEHIEMYLKAIWYIREQGEDVKVSSIAKLLSISQPSVVQMLRKLHDANLVDYRGGKNLVRLTSEGERTGKQMIRNTRLLEVMMKDALKIEIDEEMICGIEHHMKTSYEKKVYRCIMHLVKPSKKMST
jgi:DtxR family transcriptional regulator, Mn-dependent transcriptional regulator